MNGKHRHGFTLIELLAIIATLGILASLLLPAMSRAKAKVNQVSCVSKLRSWVIAMRIYLDDHDFILPREDAIDDVNSWKNTLAPTSGDVWYNCVAEKLDNWPVSKYARNSATRREFYSSRCMFRCPAARFSAAAAGYPMFSLVMNSQLIDYAAARVKESEIEVPSQTALFLDCGVPDEPPAYRYQALYNGQPKAFANRFSGRHRNAGNIAMFDGRVSAFAVSRVVCMDDENTVDRGRAIFPPTEVIWTRRRDIKP